MQIKPSTQQAIKDAMEELIDAIEAFKMSPNVSTLDDVYRATCAIDTACSNQISN